MGGYVGRLSLRRYVHAYCLRFGRKTEFSLPKLLMRLAVAEQLVSKKLVRTYLENVDEHMCVFVLMCQCACVCPLLCVCCVSGCDFVGVHT